jgi:hypothetical protein
MTKYEKVLNIIKRDGHITRFIAVNYGILALTQHISVLRKKGYNILAEQRLDANGKEYTRWFMGKAKKQAQRDLFPMAA